MKVNDYIICGFKSHHRVLRDGLVRVNDYDLFIHSLLNRYILLFIFKYIITLLCFRVLPGLIKGGKSKLSPTPPWSLGAMLLCCGRVREEEGVQTF